jgi:DNA polymerase delta subunit 4
MKRWVRANKLGLAPPIEVLAVLLKEEKEGNSQIERAYVDELMSSKFVIGEA